MTKMARIAGLGIEDIETLVQGAGPNAALSIDEQRAYRIAGQRVRYLRVVAERLELFRPPIPASHAAAVRGKPKGAMRILGDRPDVVAGQRVPIAAFAAVLAYRVAIVT